MLSQLKSRKLDECLSVLVDEIQLAMAWNRPSILFAVHRSKADQEHSMTLMECKLLEYSIKVDKIYPRKGYLNLLNEIARRDRSQNSFFFVYDLNKHFEVYAGLNLYRELIVEEKLKMIFWLDKDEMYQIARHAPDLWAFRHLVIEFPSRNSSTEMILPSGVLLWPNKIKVASQPDIEGEIFKQEKLLKKLLHDRKHTTMYMDVVTRLLYLYWLVGADDKINNTVYNNPKQLEMVHFPVKYSLFFNAQAINFYDHADYKEAAQSIEQAVELNPARSILWSNYGVISRAVGQRRKSIPRVKKAIRLNPNIPDSFGVLGYVYLLTGKYEAALKQFEKAQVLDSDHTRYFPAMAYCFHRLGNFERFHKMLYLISKNTKDNEYLTICLDALNGERTLAIDKLGTWIQQEKIPRIFIKHDPQLHWFLEVNRFPG